MYIEEEIQITLQQIGAIFLQKGIAVFPINSIYLDMYVEPGQETMLIKELYMVLEDLFEEFSANRPESHRFERYLESIKLASGENIDGKSLIGRAI